jgi:hypothetical protein
MAEEEKLCEQCQKRNRLQRSTSARIRPTVECAFVLNAIRRIIGKDAGGQKNFPCSERQSGNGSVMNKNVRRLAFLKRNAWRPKHGISNNQHASALRASKF